MLCLVNRTNIENSIMTLKKVIQKAAVKIATLTIIPPDDFMNKIETLVNSTDDILEKALDEGGRVALGIARGNLAGVLSGQSTGELAGSLGVSPAKQDSTGALNVKIGFNEPRRDQSGGRGKRSYKKRTNAMIASVLEHGRHNQPPRPFMAPARASAEGACIAAMTAVLESAVNSLL